LSPADSRAARAKIDARTAIGVVHLTVRDLDRVAAFYQDSIGLTAHRREPTVAWLGAGDQELLALWESENAKRVGGTTGLYHLAILLPSRAELGASLRRLIANHTRLHGASDHGVSEALYLSDPEGNGIEIYRDRLKADWPRVGGEIAMTSDPIDLDALAAEPGGRDDRLIAPGTVIGHVHLRVSDVAEAERFYAEALGFDVVARYESATFLSAGGYHHHIGLNAWETRGAPAAPRGSAGLRQFELRLPDQAARDDVLDRVLGAGYEVDQDDGSPRVQDPSGNRIVLEIAPRS